MRRVALIETRHGERHRHHRAEIYPFLQGLARGWGWPVDWLVLDLPPESLHLGDRYVFDLPPAARRVLRAELDATTPDVVVFHDRPVRGLLREIRGWLPEARVVDLSWRPGEAGDEPADLPISPLSPIRPIPPISPIHGGSTVADVRAALSGTVEHVAEGERLFLDVAPPRFERRFPGAADGTPRPPQALRLAVERSCPYARRLRANPLYRDLDDPVVQADRGCSFCLVPHVDARPRFQTPPVEHALRQIDAHQRVAAAGDLRFDYLLEQSTASNHLTSLLAEIAARDLRPSTIHTMCRADRLLTWREPLLELLPRIERHGHRLRLVSIGAENFSDAENQRFNKGVSASRLFDCLALIRELESRFPGTFAAGDAGTFAVILFTPWTTPDDLRVNVEAARRVGADFLERAVGSRLILLGEAAITALARSDGLVCDRFSGSLASIAPVHLVNPTDREIPWRFRDPRTARLHELLVRLAPVPEQARLPADDPLARAIADQRSALPPSLAESYVEVASALLEAVDARGPDAVLGELFAHVSELPACRAAALADARRRKTRPETGASASDPAPAPRRDDPARAPGGGSLAFFVRERAGDGARYRFHVAAHREGRPFFVRVGDLVLWHRHEEMTPAAARFGRALGLAMRALASRPPSPDNLGEWRGVVRAYLHRIGASEHFSWTARWSAED